MFDVDRRAGRIEGRWLDASAAQLLWERIVRDDPDLDPLVAPAGVARAAGQSWRRLHDHCLPLESLAEGGSPEAAAFSRWCRKFLALLEQRGWLDGALAQSRVHAAAALPGIELVGFDSFTPSQEALLARWATAGLRIERRPAPASPGVVQRVQCLDPAAEIDAAARWAAAQLDGRAGRRVAIVVPELGARRQQVRRLVERVLVPDSGLAGGPAPESQGFELAAARTLAEQPMVAAALDLLALWTAVPDLSAISRLLRNPFIAGAGDEGPARARLDARIRRYEGPGFGLIALERLAGERSCPQLAEAMAAARAIMSKWPDKEWPSNCSKYIFDVLASLGWPGGPLDSAEHQAEQRWRTLVSDLGATDEFAGRVGPGEAVGLLRDMAGRVQFEPQELRAPLLVIDPETCAGMTFDALWVCGLDASRWPPPAAPDPFLPRALQVRHGVPRASAELAALAARRTLDRLRASAAEVVLSVAAIDDDAPLLPSPLLAELPSVEAPGGWPEPRLASLQYARRPELECTTDGALPPVSVEEARRGGARVLELQSACPFRAQVELRLGARALEEPEVGVDAAERGDLVHRAMAVVWESLRTHAALVALDPAALSAVVRRAVQQALAEARRAADALMQHLLDLEADWLAEQVLAMLAVDRQRPPFAIESVEQARTAVIGALTLELRPDRIDRLADGSLAVIDYKTGASAEVKAWLDERPRLPQLPAYVQALAGEPVGAVAFARLRSGETGYVGVARDAQGFPGLREPGSRGLLKDYGSWEELLAAWRRRLTVLADEYATGDARLAPRPAHACEHCHLGAVCRIAESGAATSDEEGADD